MDSSPLISVTDLAARLHGPHVQVIDATWHIPGRGRSGRADYEEARIPGAIHVDLDDVADNRPAPPGRMLPDPARFAARLGTLGVRPDAMLVIYDGLGLYSAARVWWMLRIYGHDRVVVLDGGLPAWRAAGLPLDSGTAPAPAATNWPGRPAAPWTRDWRAVLANISDRREQLVDVRPASMFNGDTSALYPGVRSGHIPGAINLSQRDLQTPDAHLLPPAEIRRILTGAGIALDRPIVATCGSGVTACILALALDSAKCPMPAIYDGSWEEWGMRADLPAELDPPAAV